MRKLQLPADFLSDLMDFSRWYVKDRSDTGSLCPAQTPPRAPTPATSSVLFWFFLTCKYKWDNVRVTNTGQDLKKKKYIHDI